MMQVVVGSAIAVSALIGVVACWRDVSRRSNSPVVSLPSEENAPVDYSGLSMGVENGLNAAFEQTCHLEPVAGEGTTAVCESTASLISHTLQGAAHLLHH